jgi:hypothetical protein
VVPVGAGSAVAAVTLREGAVAALTTSVDDRTTSPTSARVAPRESLIAQGFAADVMKLF